MDHGAKKRINDSPWRVSFDKRTMSLLLTLLLMFQALAFLFPSRVAAEPALAPTIISLSPEDDSSDASVETELEITFNESITPVDGKNIIIKRTRDDEIVESISVTNADQVTVSEDTYTVTITPLEPFMYNTNYYVEIEAGAFQNDLGIEFAGISGKSTWNFRTENFQTYGSWRPLPEAGFTPGTASELSLVEYDGTLYLALVDGSEGDRATVMQYNPEGGIWEPLGDPGFSAGAVSDLSLRVYNGDVYVAYADAAHGDKATVMKFNDQAEGGWEPVGNEGFSDGGSSDISLELLNGVPIVAFQDGAHGDGLTVMVYYENDWLTMYDEAGFIQGPINDVSLTVYENTPYVAFQDGQNDSKLTVLRLDFGGWSPAGAPGFSAGAASDISLSSDEESLFVAYRDAANGNRATVWRYDPWSDSWELVGDEGFSTDAAADIDLFVRNGYPFVAYQESEANGNKATLMGYSGGSDGSWVIVGKPRLSDGAAEHLSVYVTEDFTFLVAYKDMAQSEKATVMILDDDEPVIELLSPEDDATDVPVGTELELTFSESVTPVAGKKLTIKKASDDSTVETVDLANPEDPEQVEVEGTQYTIRLLSDLTHNTEYYVLIDAGAFVDAAGNEYGGIDDEEGWNFRTEKGVWVPVGIPGISTGAVENNSLFVYDGVPYLAFADNDHGGKITVLRYNQADDVWVTLGDAGFSEGMASFPTLYVSNGIPYVAYSDAADDSKVTVRRYDQAGNVWETVGNAGITPGLAIFNSLYVDDGTPYLAYQDSHNGGQATVLKYDQTNDVWQPVGDPLFSEGTAANLTLRGEAGSLYVAYQDVANLQAATVMKYNQAENDWEPVGYEGFSTGGTVSYLSMDLDDDTPYVAFQDGWNADKATVMKWEGTSWESVGNPGFSAGSAEYLSIFVDESTPYVAYMDGGNGGKATVMKWDGTSWKPVGGAGFSAGSAEYLSFFIDGGTPYVAYTDGGNGGKATVMKLDSEDPEATAYFPEDGATNVAVNTELKITFSEKVTPVEGKNIVIRKSSDDSLVTTIAVDDASQVSVHGFTVTVDPAANLEYGTSYYLEIDAGAFEDVAGNGYAGIADASTWSFTTATAPNNDDDDDNDGGGSGGGNMNLPRTVQSGLQVIVNGEAQEGIAKGTTSRVNGQTVFTATVDTAQLSSRLAREGDNANIVIPVTDRVDKVSAVLTGDAVKELENKQAVLEIQTTNGNYKLPAAEVSIDQWANQFGADVPLSDIVISVEIGKSSAAKVELLENSAEQGNFAVVVPPVEFTVTATYNGRTVQVERFHSYVEREIALPEGVDPSKITTAVVLEADGTIRHVPTYINERDGKYYAVIHSLTNSSYALVWHSKTFADVEGHWAKNAVNDMASRMIVNGVDESRFHPDAAVTRAEFAAMVVRALGLPAGGTRLTYSDVKAGDWYAGVLSTAKDYGLIAGYEDGTFRPAARITRQEAVVLLERAMRLAGLDTAISEVEAASALSKFADGTSVAAWARTAVAAAVKQGLVNGSQAGLNPASNITRAETATIVQRMLQKAALIDNRNDG